MEFKTRNVQTIEEDAGKIYDSFWDDYGITFKSLRVIFPAACGVT